MAFTDREYYQLTVAMQKACSGNEQPIKTKHIRLAIIGSYQSKGGHAFWAVATRLPLQENRIVCWKFCHLFHKVLREGHHLTNQHSMKFRKHLVDAGKLWGHLNDGYGICIKHYTKLLVTKLEFHDRNPRIPGSLTLKRGELDQIGGGDINFYFQLAVEMFDYLDDIVALQATIFDSITKFRVNSMTPAGQCRLAPLIPLIQDSNPLYDHCVRVMFRLHANLSPDLLLGHRQRFQTLFQQLKSFYGQTRVLQYFESLITVPKLPDSPPNFLQQSDFGNYTAPVVVMPEEPQTPTEEEPLVSDLVDTAPEPPPRIQQLPAREEPPAVDYERIIQERDGLIQHLQTEIERMSKYFKNTSIEQRENQARFEEKLSNLNSELLSTKEDLTNLRIEKEELELKAQSAPTLEQKAQAEEERAKANEEKFQKIKTMYTQIRDEHVKLLRQHGEVNKQLSNANKLASEASQAKEEIKCQFDDLQQKQSRVEENLQQSSESSKREREELQIELSRLKKENDQIQLKSDEVMAEKSAEIADLKVSLDKVTRDFEELKVICDETKTKNDNLIAQIDLEKQQKDDFHQKYQDSLSTMMEKDDLLREFDILKNEHVELKTQHVTTVEEKSQKEHELSNKLAQEKSEREHERAEFEQKLLKLSQEKDKLEAQSRENQSEIDLLASQLEQKSANLIDLENTSSQEIQLKSGEVAELQLKIQKLEEENETLVQSVDRLSHERATLENDFQDLLHQQEQLEDKVSLANDQIQSLENALQENRISGDTALRTLLETCIRESEKIAARSINDNEMQAAGGTPSYFLMIAEELQGVLAKLAIVHEKYQGDNNTNVESLARKVILGGHLLASAHIQGMAVSNSSADIECGERIAAELKELGQGIMDLFEALHNAKESGNVGAKITNLKSQLEKVTTMIGDLSKKTDSTEIIADLVESELASMDKAIEEAANRIAEMLSTSRASDSGIKLEVNEKILDACTALMQCIRILVQKARALQAEIIALGKGTATAKEFYKRNHQWTEGLISAAKSVAQGANFLVAAANKTVSGGAKNHFDLVVAAQEIAASTAQLVVASRVKAQRSSPNLSALGQASKNVTQATGAVVATAKDCTARLEESQDTDLAGLTLHQAKTKEMEVQVKVLELEQALTQERLRLAALRRKNYQANGDDS